jgi:hypothetical protein
MIRAGGIFGRRGLRCHSDTRLRSSVREREPRRTTARYSGWRPCPRRSGRRSGRRGGWRGRRRRGGRRGSRSRGRGGARALRCRREVRDLDPRGRRRLERLGQSQGERHGDQHSGENADRGQQEHERHHRPRTLPSGEGVPKERGDHDDRRRHQPPRVPQVEHAYATSGGADNHPDAVELRYAGRVTLPAARGPGVTTRQTFGNGRVTSLPRGTKSRSPAKPDPGTKWACLCKVSARAQRPERSSESTRKLDL